MLEMSYVSICMNSYGESSSVGLSLTTGPWAQAPYLHCLGFLTIKETLSQRISTRISSDRWFLQ